VLAAAAACSSGDSRAPTARRYGDAMAEVGRRFERAGHAVAAGRWELAGYDLGEMEEVFAADLPHAARPGDVPIDPAPLAAAFVSTTLPALSRAVEARDRRAFDAAFADASRACNGCHQAAGKAFIEISAAVDAAVPDLGSVSPVGGPTD
jgi:hypothetical protein